MRGVLRPAAVLVLTLLASGCRDGAPRPAAFAPVSMDEAEDLARRFEAAMEPCNPRKLDPLIDMETMLRRGVEKTTAPAVAKRGFIAGVRSNGTIGTMLCQNVGETATYDLLRIREVDGEPRPLFRLLDGVTFNYHELQLGKSRKDHHVRVLDLHSYSTGELMSDTIASSLERSQAGAQQGENFVETRLTMKAISAAKARGDHDEVLRLLDRLPRAVRETKPVLLTELTVTAELDEASYAAVIERFERLYPGDPSLDLVALNGYFLREDGAGTLAALDRLDQKLGGDPYIGLMRATALMLDPTPAHLADAERWAKVTTDAIPTLDQGWWTLASVLLLRNDHTGVVSVLETLEADFGVAFDLDAMRAAEIYDSFLLSPEFKAWWGERD